MEIIFGKFGSGKTSLCYSQIEQELQKNKYQKLILLVPEQFNLQIQWELSLKLNHGLLFAEVLSFKNLVKYGLKSEIFRKTPIIDELERIIILKKLIETHKKELEIFSRSQYGFLDYLNQFITSCEQSGIGHKELINLEQKEGVSSVLKAKTRDISKIYTWFEEYIHNKFLTVEKSGEVLIDILKNENLFKGAKIWVDGFYSFTQVQLNILIQLALQSDSISITLPADKMYSDNDLLHQNNIFFESINTFKIISKMCKPNDIEVTTRFCELSNMQIDPDLKLLQEQYINPYRKYTAKTSSSIKLCKYPSIAVEVEEIAKQIKSFVIDQQYRYNEIVILVGDISRYRSYVETIFKEYEIPYFLDEKRNIHTNSLVTTIISLLDIMISSWSYKSISQLLKTQTLPFSSEQIDKIENYILAHGIKTRKKWLTEWAYGEEDLEELNQLRLSIVEIIKSVENELYLDKGKLTVEKISCVIYHFLNSINAYEQVEQKVVYHRLHGNIAQELENSQIWNQVIEVFERLVDILGDEKVSLLTYKQILATSFSYIKMGIIPASQDQVLIGTICRTRLPQQNIVFLMGVNEGVLPKINEDRPLFSKMDEMMLKHAYEHQENDKTYQTFMQDETYKTELSMFTALTRAKHKLLLTAPLNDESGKSIKPSTLYYKIKKMFTESETTISNGIYSPNATFGELGKNVRMFLENHIQLENEWRDMLGWYLQNPLWKPRVKAISERLTFVTQQDYLDKKTAKLLYPNSLNTSVSKLETFRKCACCYFLKYGLKASERKIFQWNSADIGQIFHSILETYPKELSKINKTWTTAEQSEREECLKSAVEHSLKQYNAAEIESGRGKYTSYRIENITGRAINALTYQLLQGKFEPKEYEVDFALTPIAINLGENTLYLKGKIDRVDVYTSFGEEYSKIIDYKSGQKKFDLLEMYYGLQLQLLLYLDAYLKLNQDAKPAGMFYFNIDVKTSELNKLKDIKEIDLIKQFKLSGLTLANQEVIEAFDEKITGNIIPVKFKKDGTLDSYSQVVDENLFDDLRKFIYKKIKDLGNDIISGKVSATPYNLKGKNACEYCQYNLICQFNNKDKRNGYDNLESLNKKNIWNLIKCEVKNNEMD
ncbi:hypothetical protein AN639_00855 [Candidatus Epulonipiscium fishelsonii]|uniref:Uncharacterized protein n=1 Tax=Candidatus Epulonipiscium fishelsonii TaxID=77094 RepID=A0ACC8XC17_9FIRM|nr:hypothetical protein AN396_01345 [Epulopiscium sp. SCG-B11WGA-EpuloA1]ONI41345.1 hypothetical protein AN639_00855 [Epulopiscium sp. SCG-B05WGA-EpuloA1]